MNIAYIILPYHIIVIKLWEFVHFIPNFSSDNFFLKTKCSKNYANLSTGGICACDTCMSRTLVI